MPLEATVCEKTTKAKAAKSDLVQDCEKAGAARSDRVRETWKGCTRRLKRRKLRQAIVCGKTAGSERCGKVAVHKEMAEANAEDSCEMAKARETMCEGKETVCKEIAKGEWDATRKWPCARNDKVVAVMRDHLQRGCEKAQQATMCKRAAECGETAEGCVRPGKYLRSDDSLSLSPVGIE